MPTKIIVAHLGNGASLCAIHHGRSVATTMGFTAVEGLMMGTRCGSIDPGVLIYLMDERKMDARALEDLIYKKSGLLGVSGISSDMRTLRASDDPRRARRSTCSSIGSSAKSARWRPRSAAWTAWSSPAASASAMPRPGDEVIAGCAFTRSGDRRAAEAATAGSMRPRRSSRSAADRRGTVSPGIPRVAPPLPLHRIDRGDGGYVSRQFPAEGP